MIKLQHVHKIFKTDFWSKPFVALNDVSFSIQESDLVGFLGANGAGKTTSLKILMKFIKADAGEVLFDKKLGSNMIEVLSNIGYVPERPYFYPYLSGREFVTFMGQLNGVARGSLKERINQLFQRFQIDYALDRKIKKYSKGMLQRLGLISAIIHDPKVIILDEPLSGLDPVGRKEVKLILKELHKEGKTIFFSSHIVSDIEEICNSIVVLEKGKLIFEGSVAKIVHENTELKMLAKVSGIKHESVELGKRVEQLADNISSYEVPIAEKDAFVKHLIEKGGTLITLQNIQPTLEEIIYHLGD